MRSMHGYVFDVLACSFMYTQMKPYFKENQTDMRKPQVGANVMLQTLLISVSLLPIFTAWPTPVHVQHHTSCHHNYDITKIPLHSRSMTDIHAYMCQFARLYSVIQCLKLRCSAIITCSVYTTVAKDVSNTHAVSHALIEHYSALRLPIKQLL